MKKLLALVVVLAVAWLGATYYVGMRMESVVREDVAKRELIPGRKDLMLDVLDYDRGLFSSRALVCVIVQGQLAATKNLGAMSGKLCTISTIHHGPLAWTEDGPYFGLAASREVLDLSELPKHGKAMVKELFKGKPPLVGTSRYAFDGGMAYHLTVSPANMDSPMGQVALQQFDVDVFRPSVDGYPVNGFITVKGLKVNSLAGGVAIPSLTGSVDVLAMLGDDLPLTAMNLTAKGLQFIQGDQPVLTLDATLQGTSQDQGNTLSGKSGLWLDKVSGPIVPLPMDSAYLGVSYDGLDKQALIRVNQLKKDLDRLQSNMMMGMLDQDSQAGGDFEAQMKKMRSLMEELTQVASEKLLRPGNSRMAVQLLVDNKDQRQLSLDSKARYLGMDGKNLPFDQLKGLPADALRKMLDLDVRLDVNNGLIPPMFADKVSELQDQGLVVRAEQGWSASVITRDGALLLNGQPVTQDELEQRLRSLAPTPPQPAPGAEVDPLAQLQGM
ncbi:hypothetical protein A11A3_07313 [Alcanivorax hongdengensis A-11-3]|uniref:DUF945 domain-containing protein n=1 Tax=Alcanivorax hongdengensis A-11-3 TaxID=1177179 RepID=L0WC87_9GAMM|nr:DUF945 family protein [Alcanivorax hongdengensis]EKF74609.1 hypothetical protein A11A3_07313 [Alcanivorax hongdengensis A-11-3]